MSHDHLVLLLIGLTPLLLLAVTIQFFCRWKLHKRGTWFCLVLGNGLIFLLLLSCALCAAEIYFRFFLDVSDAINATRISGKWFERHWRFNATGFRDSVPEYKLHPATGVRRVTFVGDSFTAGHGVADVGARFANLYRDAMPDREVHVFARCGWDTAEELQCLQGFAQNGYRFDLVVLCYCLNDIEMPEVDAFQQRFRPSYFFRHSFCLNWLYYRAVVGHGPYGRHWSYTLRQDYEGSQWNLQRQLLTTMNDLVKAKGGRLVAVTLPFPSIMGPAYPFARAQEQLAGFWKGLGVPHLDLHDVFAANNPRDLVVHPFDGHPNERGHALIFESLVPFLEDKWPAPDAGSDSK